MTFRRIDAFVSDYSKLQAIGLWSAAVVTGIVAVAYAGIFRGVEHWFASLIQNQPFVTFAITPLSFAFAWWLVRTFAPEAGGSGIPQVMAAVEMDYETTGKPYVDRLLSVRTAIVKILSSLLCLVGGGAIGREGPTLQISAAIFHFFGKQVRRFYPKSDERTWIIAGSAAGLASAFNTPLGGIVYAIEELAMSHFHRIRTALFSAVIISGIVSQTLLGSYLYLGYPQLQPMQASVWPLVVLTGLISGLSGAIFSAVLLRALSWRAKYTSLVSLGFIALGCGLAASALNYHDTYNAGPGSHLINKILFNGEFASTTMVFERMLSTGFAYLSGAAGGVFSPALTIGACIGSKIAYLAGSTNSNLLAMLGMIGFLTGLTHTPFTSFILVLEMSDRHSAIFPMMIAALIAHGVAKLVQKKSFYERTREKILSSAI